MTKSEVCKNCCTHGGAVFVENFGRFQHVSTQELMADAAWVKVCQNCGHYKLKRKSKPRLSFDDIMDMPDDSRLSNKKERAIFHAHAEAGAWQQYVAICDTYCAKKKAGGTTMVPVMMISYYCDYHYRKLCDHLKLSAYWVDYHIGRLKDQVVQAHERINADFLESEVRDGCRL